MTNLNQAFNISSFSGETFGEFMASIESSMTNLVQQTSRVPKDFQENFEAFIAAVNWEDKLIHYLGIFHLSLFLLFMFTRKNVPFQSCLFFFISGLLFFAEKLNSWGAENWREIASQNYFDKHGAFAGIFFASPLLFICFLQLINFLAIASSDLIKVKRLQLKQQQQQKSTEAKKSD